MPRVLGIAGYSGSGKTTLIEQCLPRLAAQGLRVSVLKHTHHAVDLDQPGKDSWRHRQAGAHEVLLASGTRWALLHELHQQPEPELAELLARLSPCDLVLVEGWKHDTLPKLEVHRPALGKPLLAWDVNTGRVDPSVVAVASDAPPPAGFALPLPWLDLHQPDQWLPLVLQHAVDGL